MKERRIVRCVSQACFCSFSGGGRDYVNLGAPVQLCDDLPPLPRFWENAKSDMAHADILRCRRLPQGPRPRKCFEKPKLTPRLPKAKDVCPKSITC
jgi:hypothetical protein